MKKQQKGFERNIREKFIITAIIPVMLLLFAFTCFMWYSSKMMLERKTREAGERIAENVARMDQNYRKSCVAMAESPEVLSFLATREGSGHVFEKYYQSVMDQDIKFQMVIVDRQKNIILRSSSKDGYKPDYSFMPLQKMAEQKKHGETRIFSRVASGELTYYYGYGAVIYEKEEPVGYVIYYVSNRGMGGLLEESGAEEVVITNQFDTVIVTTSETARDPYNKLTYEKEESGNLSVNGTQYYMNICTMEKQALKVYTLGSRIYEQYFFQIIPPFIFVVLLVLCFLMYYLSKDMSRRVTEPIDKLMEAVDRTAKGHFDVKLELNTGDEFELLAGEYNRMVRQVDQLIVSNSQMAELQRESEFKIIRNQFNPHFIFNVLETLRYMVFVDQKETEKTILALAKFLRYNIYNQDKFVPLSEDMEHMEDFFVLHKARFQERMTYEIHMDDAAKAVFVPKFFTQPFAENSIKYGFKNRDRFHISVCAVLREDKLLVSVKDNGGGMAEEKYKEVCVRLDADQYPDDHIGLYNINKMLKLIYGEEYGLHLINTEGEGLEVQVEIPARES